MEEKKRSANFTAQEKYNLISLIASKYASILEDKKTDRASVVDRMKTWKKIEEEFNASSKSSILREWGTLKRFYENRKKDVRKLKAKYVQNQFRTGGGPEEKSEMDSADQLLISIMNQKTVSGMSNPFDCDDDHSKIVPNEAEIEFVFENEELDVQDNDNNYDDNTEKYTQRPPKDRIIGELVSIRDIDKENIEIGSASTSQDSNWKKACNLQTQIHPALKVNLSTSMPASDVFTSPRAGGSSGSGSVKYSKTPVGKDRRRPTQTIRTLTSSHVADKYNVLLDRRIVLIEKQILQIDEERAYQEKRRKLELELLALEVEKKK